jgi:hypothetical protein
MMEKIFKRVKSSKKNDKCKINVKSKLKEFKNKIAGD